MLASDFLQFTISGDVNLSHKVRVTEETRMKEIEYIRKQGDFDYDRNLVEIVGLRRILERYGIDYYRQFEDD